MELFLKVFVQKLRLNKYILFYCQMEKFFYYKVFCYVIKMEYSLIIVIEGNLSFKKIYIKMFE